MKARTIASINPSTYKTIGTVPMSTESEIVQKVKLAHFAKKQWKTIGVSGRVKALKTLYRVCDKNRSSMASLASDEMGFPVAQALAFDMGDGLNYFRWYLENAEKYLSPEVTFENAKGRHTVMYEPTGVAAVIVPWNWPFSNWVWGTIPNLVAGNTVVFKHSEECILFGKLLDDLVAQSNLPNGVFNQVYGAGVVGDALVHQSVDLISFTGSTKVGKYLYELAGKKFIRALMELGGSAPGIVFEDVRISDIIEPIFDQRFTNCGQACDALKRLIVHERIFGEVVEKLTKKVQLVTIGNPSDVSTEMGPLVAKRQLNLLGSQVDDAVAKGATVVTGGKKPKNLPGAYYEPTILTNIKPSMRVWKEEVFGPVLPVVSFKTEQEAIDLANDTQYGLGAYVYTSDKQRAARVASQIDSGMVSVNGTNYVTPANPFGGYKQSGIGREHGKYGLRELCQLKVVSTNK